MSNQILAPFIDQRGWLDLLGIRRDTALRKLNDPDDTTSGWDLAVELGRLGEIPPVTAILTFYQDEDPEVRDKVVEVIDRIGLGVEHLLLAVLDEQVQKFEKDWFWEMGDQDSMESVHLIEDTAKILVTRTSQVHAHLQDYSEKVREESGTILENLALEIAGYKKKLEDLVCAYSPEQMKKYEESSLYMAPLDFREHKEKNYPWLVETCRRLVEIFTEVQMALTHQALQWWVDDAEEMAFD